MANVTLNEQHLTNIANAIRAKKGTSNQMKPGDMASEISSIQVGSSGSGGLDTSDATAISNDVLTGKTAYARGMKITGSMANNGRHHINISQAGTGEFIPEGYHDGTGYVSIDNSEKAKFIPENIRNGVSLLGVTGNYVGSGGSGIDTSDATATASDILQGKTAYAKGNKIVGTIGKRSGWFSDITNVNDSILIPEGFYDGVSSHVEIVSSERAKIIPENIKQGVTILGVAGACQSGGGGSSGAQVKTGTTTTKNISTGLSKIDYFFLYTDKIYSLGVVSLSFNQAKNECSLTFCGDYSVYSKYCNTVIKKPFIVSGGDIVWTESMAEYCLMTGATYNWVAIGS